MLTMEYNWIQIVHLMYVSWQHKSGKTTCNLFNSSLCDNISQWIGLDLGFFSYFCLFWSDFTLLPTWANGCRTLFFFCFFFLIRAVCLKIKTHTYTHKTTQKVCLPCWHRNTFRPKSQNKVLCFFHHCKQDCTAVKDKPERIVGYLFQSSSSRNDTSISSLSEEHSCTDGTALLHLLLI